MSGALVVLFSFYAINLVLSYRLTIAAETKRLLSQAEIVQKNFGLQLQTTANALDAIRSVAETDLTESNGLTLTGRLELFQKSLLGVRTVAIVDANGITVASNRPEVVGFDARATERYHALRSGNDPSKLYISSPYITPQSKYSIALGKVRQDAHGNFDGYVLAVIDPEYYQVIFSSVLNTPDSMISLVHESGKLIYRIPSIDGMEKVDLRSAPSAAIWQFEASGKSLDFIKATLATTGTLRYMALAKLKPTTTQADHYLVTTISRDVAMVDARWFEDQIPSLTLLLALAVVSIIGLAMYQNRQTAFAHLRLDASAEKSKSDLALRQTHELLTMSEQAAGSGAWSWTIGNDQLNWSGQMFKLFGIDPATSEANFDTWRKLVHPDDLTGAEQSIADSLRDHKPFATAYRIIRPNGDIVWIDAYGNPTFDPDGKPLRFAGICVDATARHLAENQLRESEQRYRQISHKLEALNADLEAKVAERTAALEAAMLTLEQFSRRDALTSLPNRLAADERLRGEFVSMKRSGAPYAVMMLDIDYFKKINDTFGHAVGDDVLRYTSKAMRTSLRENDFVCRYGGEEFLILLPATDLEEARGVAEKVRLAVATVSVPVAGCNTISIGVALATPSDADEEVALKVADDRLYEAKRSGRNRVVHTS